MRLEDPTASYPIDGWERVHERGPEVDARAQLGGELGAYRLQLRPRTRLDARVSSTLGTRGATRLQTFVLDHATLEGLEHVVDHRYELVQYRHEEVRASPRAVVMKRRHGVLKLVEQELDDPVARLDAPHHRGIERPELGSDIGWCSDAPNDAAQLTEARLVVAVWM